MRVYLIQKKDSLNDPRIITAPDAATACESAGLTIETAYVKDVTRRTIKPHHLVADDDTNDLCDHPCEEYFTIGVCPCTDKDPERRYE